MSVELTPEQWAPIRDAVMEYGNHFAEAALHQSASKADISHASALSALQSVRRAIEAATKASTLASEPARELAERVVKAIEDAYSNTEHSVPKAFCSEASDAAYGAIMDALAAAPEVPAARRAHEAEPLVEPVTIFKAMRAHRLAEVWLNEGTGPVCCVALVNIQIEPWNRHTPTEAKAFADGFNLAAKWMRDALAATQPAPEPQAVEAVAPLHFCQAWGSCAHCAICGAEMPVATGPETPKAVAEEVVSGSDGPRLKVPQDIIDQIGRYGIFRGYRFTLNTQFEWERLIEAIGAWGYRLATPPAAPAAAEPQKGEQA